jgi:hypothetical protein
VPALGFVSARAGLHSLFAFGRSLDFSPGGHSALNSIAGTSLLFEPRHSYADPAASRARRTKAKNTYRIASMIPERAKTTIRRR